MSFILAVAQKVQFLEQPAWVETQRVFLLPSGINTDSILTPSPSWKRYLTVRSVSESFFRVFSWEIQQPFSVRSRRKGLLKGVIFEISRVSLECMKLKMYRARYFFWPKLSTISSSSSKVLFFKSLSISNIVQKKRQVSNDTIFSEREQRFLHLLIPSNQSRGAQNIIRLLMINYTADRMKYYPYRQPAEVKKRRRGGEWLQIGGVCGINTESVLKV
jgi:hypothetical protein